jgi:hypothetical protein
MVKVISAKKKGTFGLINASHARQISTQTTTNNLTQSNTNTPNNPNDLTKSNTSAPNNPNDLTKSNTSNSTQSNNTTMNASGDGTSLPKPSRVAKKVQVAKAKPSAKGTAATATTQTKPTAATAIKGTQTKPTAKPTATKATMTVVTRKDNFHDYNEYNSHNYHCKKGNIPSNILSCYICNRSVQSTDPYVYLKCPSYGCAQVPYCIYCVFDGKLMIDDYTNLINNYIVKGLQMPVLNIPYNCKCSATYNRYSLKASSAFDDLPLRQRAGYHNCVRNFHTVMNIYSMVNLAELAMQTGAPVNYHQFKSLGMRNTDLIVQILIPHLRPIAERTFDKYLEKYWPDEGGKISSKLGITWSVWSAFPQYIKMKESTKYDPSYIANFYKEMKLSSIGLGFYIFLFKKKLSHLFTGFY